MKTIYKTIICIAALGAGAGICRADEPSEAVTDTVCSLDECKRMAIATMDAPRGFYKIFSAGFGRGLMVQDP